MYNNHPNKATYDVVVQITNNQEFVKRLQRLREQRGDFTPATAQQFAGNCLRKVPSGVDWSRVAANFND